MKKYTICFTKTYYVDVEADSVDHAQAIYEDMDVDTYEENSLDLQHIEYSDDEGNFQTIYY